ncbi:hypothetical protein [Bacillus sp. 71mf]|uniref:hypothetical protein n=1 Tax=Bacillus sp. 71mf TaxID=1761757 RepID=UPI001587887E|nr:hypothetical protein [Bacillus sp. 71mf]
MLDLCSNLSISEKDEYVSLKDELIAEHKTWFKQLVEHELEGARLIQSDLP